ncbi:3150_t:CDS:2, partial [Gigaspora margarita]
QENVALETTTTSTEKNIQQLPIRSPTTLIQPQDPTLTETNMMSQPNPEVNKQPDIEGLEEEIQELRQDKQNSQDKQAGLETDNLEDIEVTEENDITEISNEEMQI